MSDLKRSILDGLNLTGEQYGKFEVEINEAVEELSLRIKNIHDSWQEKEAEMIELRKRLQDKKVHAEDLYNEQLAAVRRRAWAQSYANSRDMINMINSDGQMD